MRKLGDIRLISEDIVARIKEANDIVDIISEDIILKRSGANYTGRCPFHNEKTASFVVSPQKQIYKCFGCNEAGNVITYIMKTKKYTFPEACEYLADKANIQLNNKENKYNNELAKKRQRAFEINTEVARYYFNNLRVDKVAQNYFLERGLTQKSINKFGLGYALNSWNSLISHLKNKGYSELEMLEMGLITKDNNKGNYYDKFRNRVMFPVFNVQGKVIGFGGRVLDDSKPKYLNSPETIVFHKGVNLYGLNFAVKGLSSRRLIVVEGYMDCIALVQYGITNVVASLGTAFTNKQAKLLKRYVDEIIISFDSDDAGVAATMRGIEILREEGFKIRILEIPDGKDPDQYVKKHGKNDFENLINNAKNLVEYKLETIEKDVNYHDSEQKIEFVKRSVEVLADLNPAEKDIYIKKICEKTGLSEDTFYHMLKDKINDEKKYNNMNENGNYSQKLYLEPAYLKAERNLLNLMMNNYGEYILNIINEDELILNSHKKIFYFIKESLEENKENILSSVESKCQDESCIKEFVRIKELECSNIDDIEMFIRNCCFEVKKYKLEESKKEIMKNIKEKERNGLIEECLRLANELKLVENELMNLDDEVRR